MREGDLVVAAHVRGERDGPAIRRPAAVDRASHRAAAHIEADGGPACRGDEMKVGISADEEPAAVRRPVRLRIIVREFRERTALAARDVDDLDAVARAGAVGDAGEARAVG